MSINHSKGFGLIEMLVVLALGSFIMIFLSRLLFSMQQQVTLVKGRSTVQYHGQLAMHLLREALHRQSKLTEANDVVMSVSTQVTILSKKQPEVPRTIKRRMKSGSDVLLITMTDKVKHKSYYYVAKTSYQNAVGAAVYSLYSKEDNRRAQELIPGVSVMRVQFMGSPLQGQGASPQSFHGGLIKLQLLVDSIDPVLSTARAYRFDGKTFTAIDHKLYQAWTGWFNIGRG